MISKKEIFLDSRGREHSYEIVFDNYNPTFKLNHYYKVIDNIKITGFEEYHNTMLDINQFFDRELFQHIRDINNEIEKIRIINKYYL